MRLDGSLSGGSTSIIGSTERPIGRLLALPGSKGDKGDKGDIGDKGDKGDTGGKGDTGLQGPMSPLRRPLRNTFAAVGDSMVAMGSLGNESNRPLVDQAYLNATSFQLLQILSHQRIRYCGGNYAVSSSAVNAQAMELTHVLAMNPLPGACLLASGAAEMVNNVTWSFTAAKGLIESMVASLLAVGVVPILWCIPPVSKLGLTVTPAVYKPNMQQWNAWIRRYAAMNGFALIDGYTALAQVNGTYLPGTSDDNLHPNAYGHTLIVKQALADGLADIFPPNSLVNTARTNDDLHNLFNDGTINQGVFTTDSNSDGIADGLTLTGTLSCALVPPVSTDQLLGNWQQITATAGNTGSLSAVISSGWSVGDTIAFSSRVQTQNMTSSVGKFSLAIREYIPAGLNVSDGTNVTLVWNGIMNWSSADISDGEVYVEFIIPPGTTTLTFYAWILSVTSGSATLRFGETTIRNLTTGGILG